jgi:hypothetical protein
MIPIQITLPKEYPFISKLPLTIQSSVLRALKAGMKTAEGAAQSRHMSGPRPGKLGVVTGLLRSRVWGYAASPPDPSIYAIGILSNDVLYAPTHEYGATISHPGVSGKTMRFRDRDDNNKFVFTKRVRPHFIKIPARPFLTPGLEESIPEITSLIQSAIDRGLGSL